MACPSAAPLRSTSIPHQRWTADEEAYLREHYQDGSTAAIAAHLRRPVPKIYAKAGKLGLAKSVEYLRSSCRLRLGHSLGRATQFSKGHVPANKGLRRPGYGPGRMKETQFRKGQRTGMAAKNWRPVGTILPGSDGYLRIKVREAKHGKEPTGFGNTKVWPLYQRYVWEQHNGPIPSRHLVVFKDGNKQNCAIENLECISMAENARRNAMWNNYPREMAEAIQMNGVLKRKLRRLNGEKQNV